MYKRISQIFDLFKKMTIFLFIGFLVILKLKNSLHLINGSLFIIFAVLFFLFKYFQCLFESLDMHDKSIMKKGMKFYFIMYIILIILALFMDRNINLIRLDINWFGHLSSSNFVPFVHTIEMVKRVMDYGNYEALSLLIGNIIMLIPLGFFLPRLFEKTKKFGWFSLSIFITTLLIETIQLATDTGFFDIDDIIFNTIGVLIFFYPFNKSSFSKILDKIFLLSDDKISKKDMIISFFGVVFVIIIFLITICCFYNQDIGSEMEIVCEKDDCNGDELLIYEDDNYLYYVKEDCYNYIYIDFKKDKYLLKDYLNGAGRKIYHNLWEISNIQFRYRDIIDKESKYYETFVNYPGRKIKFEYEVNDELVEIEFISDEILIDNYTKYYRIKPKHNGKVTLKWIIKDYYDDEKVLDIIYKNYVIFDDLKIEEVEE